MGSRASDKTDKAGKRRSPDVVFAAMGDVTRLTLMGKLSDGRERSIAQLTHGSKLTRQGITKHLTVLEKAGVVRAHSRGRERMFALDAAPISDARRYLEQVSLAWDEALGRLKAFVED